jgi:hypothetical protein
MACPSRKNLMVCRIIKDRKNKKTDIKKIEEPISEEEHQQRLQKLKDIGLIK